MEVHSDEVRSVEMSEEHGKYITASFDGRICLIDESSLSKTFVTHNTSESADNVVYAGFHPSGGVASCSRLGLCNIYSFR